MSAERNVKFLDDKVQFITGDVEDNNKEVGAGSHVKVQDGGLVNLNSPLFSSLP